MSLVNSQQYCKMLPHFFVNACYCFLKYMFFIFLFFSHQLTGQEVGLVFFGDVMGHSPQINSAARDGGKNYDYTECFQYIEPYFRSGEITVGNLELTLAKEPYTGYPAFSSPDAVAIALKDAGVNFLVTANNHSCDRRKKGVDRTIDILDENYMLHTGTFKDSADMEKNNPLLLSIFGIRLAIINYTYGTNGIPVTTPNIINIINRDDISRHLEIAKNYTPDKTIVVIHWGEEYHTVPNKEQTELAQFLFDNGVDIIIGGHPHVIQPMHLVREKDKPDKLLVYSLGNFISNQRKPYTDGGAMVRFVLTKNDSVTNISNVEHLLTWVYTPVVDGRKRYYVLPASIYQKKGVPDNLPKGYDAMFEYLRLARGVMKNNTDVPEATEEWPLR